MRKYAAYGAAALLIVSSIAGVSYAQDTTPAPSSTEVVAPSILAQRTWLGVTVNEAGDGVTVVRVSANSPAEAAGVQVGDVILAVNDTSVDTLADLQAIIEAAAPGDVVSLTIERGAEQISVDATLSSRADRGQFGMLGDALQAAEARLNATLEAVDGGYQVIAVSDASPFDLVEGDVITAVNGEPITSVNWMLLVDPAGQNPAGQNTVSLTVQRDGAEVTLEGQLDRFGGRGGFFPGGQPGNGQRNGNGAPNNQMPGMPGRQPGMNNGQPNGSGGQPGGNPPDNGQPQPDNNGTGTTI